MDYKIQGSTLTTTILDLKNNFATKGKSGYKKFCSLYVQLSWLRSFKGLYLLQKLDMENLQFQLDKRLLAEMERLHLLERETIAQWKREQYSN